MEKRRERVREKEIEVVGEGDRDITRGREGEHV